MAPPPPAAPGHPGRIVVLNGAPRSGKSSIVREIQTIWEGPWINLGVDTLMDALPERYRPGIGLRPGGERPDLEPLVRSLYAGLYESVAAHSRLGIDVVVDVGHHDLYSRPLGILPDAARRLDGLPALLVGVRCEIGEVLRRRSAAPRGRYDTSEAAAGGAVPEPVARWQDAVHRPGIYDLEVDTTARSPAECAATIRWHLDHTTPTAFSRLAPRPEGRSSAGA